MDISKKDWKLFREKLSGWQENYMEGLVKEYANFLNDDKKPASEKFWELEKRIKEDKRHPGVVMELKKSEVIWDIVRLIRLKVITYNDLSDFSDELQNEVKRILSYLIFGISHFLHHNMNHTTNVHCIILPVSLLNIRHCYCITIAGIYNKQDISSFYFRQMCVPAEHK